MGDGSDVHRPRVADFCRAREVNLSEMLPAVDEAWLPDEKRNSYTSEFVSAARAAFFRDSPIDGSLTS